jgi:CPA1 family monovalent cation:H+ antiporter
MEHLEIVIAALFISIAGLNALASWLGIPYPIPLVLGGLGLALVPGIPEIELEPELILIVFLPPLLYSAAFFSDLRTLRRSIRTISLLAIGLVLLTMSIVAVLAHEVIGMSWPVAFALGAIVSPTDPVAATAVMRRLGAPRTLVNVIEGESLVSDATALVAYKIAIAVAVGGSFSFAEATLQFVGGAAGGIAIGLAVAWVVAQVRVRITDSITEMTISLFTGYAAFLPADELGCSGVLAAVTAGVYLGFRAPELTDARTRLETFPLWSVIAFLMNAFLFILIGLQLPIVVEGLHGRTREEVVAWAALIVFAVVAARYLWMFTTPYLVRLVDRREVQRSRRSGWRERVVGGWSGMRGAVTMAAALAVPFETDAGAPFPDRDLIIFIAFAVVLATIVIQGLTLPALIRRMGVLDDGEEEEREELRARLTATKAAMARLDELAREDWTRDGTIERVRAQYDFRHRRFAVRAGKAEDDGIEERSIAYQRLMHSLYDSQRDALTRLRNDGTISNDVMHRIERELDLEEARLDVTADGSRDDR